MVRAIIYKLFPDHPEAFKIGKIAEALAKGALALYPSDTVYAIGCDPHNRSAIERLIALKPTPSIKLLTILCPSLTDLARYAHIETAAFKLMKSLTPGPYTFILQGTKEVPRLVLNPKRKTVGVRIPAHKICQALLERLSGLMVSSSAKLPGTDEAQSMEELIERFKNHVDVIIDDGEPLRKMPSTIIDLTTPEFEIIREGLGMEALAPLIK